PMPRRFSSAARPAASCRSPSSMAWRWAMASRARSPGGCMISTGRSRKPAGSARRSTTAARLLAFGGRGTALMLQGREMAQDAFATAPDVALQRRPRRRPVLALESADQMHMLVGADIIGDDIFMIDFED